MPGHPLTGWLGEVPFVTVSLGASDFREPVPPYERRILDEDRARAGVSLWFRRRARSGRMPVVARLP